MAVIAGGIYESDIGIAIPAMIPHNTAMVESYVIKNAQLVLPQGVREGDIRIHKGRIQKIAPHIAEGAEVVIAEKGLTVFAGCIDTHVHFREPGPMDAESIASGSKAAVSGGVTAFFDMPNTNPPTITVADLEDKHTRAHQTSWANYNFYIGATHDNLDDLLKATNCPGIKVFMGSSTGNMLVDDDETLHRLFKHANKPIVIHSEDESIVQANKQRYAGSRNPADHMAIRSPEAALACTKRAVALAKRYQRRLHILHLTTADEVDWLMAQDLPPYITTEVCIQHLLLRAPGVYERLGTFAQINPPLRTDYHADRLWYGLKQGLIAAIVTDHAPHSLSKKSQPFGQAPSGMPGVETLLPLTLQYYHNQRATLTDVSRWLSAAPQRLFGIPDRGQLIEGYYADLAVVDLQGAMTITNASTISHCGWTAFDGMKLKGRPIMTFVNGQQVYREGGFFWHPTNAMPVTVHSGNLG